MLTESDGHPFGTTQDTGWTLRRTVSVRDKVEKPCDVCLLGGAADGVFIAPTLWTRIAEAVAWDFNERLTAKGRDPGAWPSVGGGVSLHPQFGRELEVLMMAIDGPQTCDEALGLWLEADPVWRRNLHAMIAPGLRGVLVEHWEAGERMREREDEPQPYPCDRDAPIIRFNGTGIGCVNQLLLEELRIRSPSGDQDLSRENRVLGPRLEAMRQIRGERKRWGWYGSGFGRKT